jgi:hypothetical protein
MGTTPTGPCGASTLRCAWWIRTGLKVGSSEEPRPYRLRAGRVKRAGTGLTALGRREAGSSGYVSAR